ncbi:MAG: c-type cytochrome [Bacteroidota bacterium]
MLPKLNLNKIALLFAILITPLIISATQNAFAQAADIPTDAESISAGENLFKQNCTVCHAVETKVLGPALKNVYDRRELPWIYAFVRNSTQMIADGDEQAVAVFEENLKIPMTPFDFLSDQDIMSILAYIKDQTDNPPVVETAPTAATVTPASQAKELPTKYINAILIGGIILLVLLLIVLFMMVSTLAKYIGQRNDISEEDKAYVEKRNPMEMIRNKAFIGIVVGILTAVIAKETIDTLYHIGVQQGYAPKQPIAYSHKVHAGDYQIDCNYCHTGVTKSKNANIPSPNICLNCHSSITTGTNTGTTEIDKIFAAVENNEPIEWVRVHNLPDLAYFNHAQHVAVGKLECEECHGLIEEMEVVRQYADLTMGWCVNCHRDTELNTKGNAYYDRLVELHENETDEPFTVEANGGLDCAKCHY